MNNHILCLGALQVYWPLKHRNKNLMHVCRLLTPFFSWIRLEIHSIHCWVPGGEHGYRMCACGQVEGCTVTCWWLVTYCFLPLWRDQASSIFLIATQVKDFGCRTAQLLNYLHTFSQQHVCERVGNTCGKVMPDWSALMVWTKTAGRSIIIIIIGYI